MKINSIKFINHSSSWELEKTVFDRVTLLVGVSGAGKTQILQAIMSIKEIVKGKSLNGVEWEIDFSTNDNGNYKWSGKFETIPNFDQLLFNLTKRINKSKNDDDDDDESKMPKLIYEKLYRNDLLVYERDEQTIKFQEQELPKISPYKSLLNILTEEAVISPVIEAFRKIHLFQYERESRLLLPTVAVKNCKLEFNDLELIKKTRIPVIHKLALLYQCFPSLFNSIKEDFINIFGQVDDVRFTSIATNAELGDIYIMQIKEKGTGWISQFLISSGMYKTLLHIVETKLLEDGTVVLIDEFENSLGVNCIDVLADDITSSNRGIQFIITSHHPYIINNINMNNWKIVMRQGSKVFTKRADELNLGKSKHQAFKQLINSKEYNVGISEA